MQISFQNYNVGVLNLNIIFYECLNNKSYLNRGKIKISLFSFFTTLKCFTHEIIDLKHIKDRCVLKLGVRLLIIHVFMQTFLLYII